MLRELRAQTRAALEAANATNSRLEILEDRFERRIVLQEHDEKLRELQKNSRFAMNSLDSTNSILDKQNLQIEKQDADFKSAQNILMEKHDADSKSLSTDHPDLLSKMDELGMQVQRHESVHAHTYNGDVPLEISGGTTASPNSNARADEDTGRPTVAEGQASELWKEQIIGYLVNLVEDGRLATIMMGIRAYENQQLQAKANDKIYTVMLLSTSSIIKYSLIPIKIRNERDGVSLSRYVYDKLEAVTRDRVDELHHQFHQSDSLFTESSKIAEAIETKLKMADEHNDLVNTDQDQHAMSEMHICKTLLGLLPRNETWRYVRDHLAARI